MMTQSRLALIALLLLPAWMKALPQDTCEHLAALKIPETSIVTAQTVAAGAFVGPPAPYSGVDISSLYKSLPAFCRVVASARPSSDSDIRIEVWLPLEGWNGKLQGFGNGGFAGFIDTMSMGFALNKGYAATATDTGHTGSPVDAKWAPGHPEKLKDFGYRGIHEMTRAAKAVIESFYKKGPRYSYFAGCSDGGREALMEAQRYPEDYNGILAGAPANYWTRLLSLAAFDTRTLTVDSGSYIPPAKIPAIAAAVNAACDKRDGVADGILNDPRECRFDPATIKCKQGEDSDNCLTEQQVNTLRTLYAGLHDSRGRSLFPGYLPGGETGPGGWGLWITGPAPGKSLMAAFAQGYFGEIVYGNPGWDVRTFELEPALKLADEKTASEVNAVDPNLEPFRKRGGKLILYHGWNDPAIPALNTIDYYQSVTSKMGQQNAESFVRLYMVPGMQHCG
ncbi:MAG TPA: tannase/feruloyl esterase family alpha/beta hydrolase, partial [Terriglobales bacterium]|nr:tannase/feruloyl esterase family alpha/beta hydrolase [Terriglobales bacterium]